MHVRTAYFLALVFTVLSGSCNAQVKTKPQDDTAAGYPRIRRTQATTQYANVYCSMRDHSGKLWFGTMGEGIYVCDPRLADGKTNAFRQYTVTNGLTANHVYAICEDVNGTIWLGTAYGICKYDGQRFSGVPIVAAGESSLSAFRLPSGPYRVNQHGVPDLENTVWSVMQDSRGSMWFGTSVGVYQFDGAAFTRFPGSGVTNTADLHLKMVADMKEDSSGNIWFCSGMRPGDEGICRYDGKSLVQFKPDNEGWIRNAVYDRSGALCFATRHSGIQRFDGTGFTNITEKAGIDNAGLTTVFKDRSGNLWMGTELGSGDIGEDGGVWRYDGKTFTRFTTRDGLVHNGVYCIAEDDSGNLWFGTRNIGLCRYDGKTFTRFSD